MTTTAIKKELQKTVASIRTELKTGNYPKAMMTGQQMDKSTATINCGEEGSETAKRAAAIASHILQHPNFKEFLEHTGAKATAEAVKSSFSGKPTTQVRIYYTAD